jgi:hypothetical protein
VSGVLRVTLATTLGPPGSTYFHVGTRVDVTGHGSHRVVAVEQPDTLWLEPVRAPWLWLAWVGPRRLWWAIRERI